MLYEGLSRKIGLRLLDIECDRNGSTRNLAFSELYLREKEPMNRVMFKDSYYIVRFVEVFSECIKKTHNMLPYILRNQYKNCEDVFKSIQNVPDNKKIQELMMMPMFEALYREVMIFIISPLLRRHGVYSPNIALMVMVDLYMHMIGEYVGFHIRDMSREYLRSYVQDQTAESIDHIAWLSPSIKVIMKDELDVWKSMKRIHRRKS